MRQLLLSVSFGVVLAVAGCADLGLGFGSRSEAPAEVMELPEGTQRPVARPENLGETVVVAGRAEASAGPLGTTVVSLGSASEPGLWLKTPLVAKTRPGSVQWQGKQVAVTLIPIEGASSAGSRMSLAAMQAIGIPLTELTEVSVSAS